jgi:phosphatidylserine/phosphatidylglycerophosphate/cardiolipin synthase-like enzyme
LKHFFALSVVFMLFGIFLPFFFILSIFMFGVSFYLFFQKEKVNFSFKIPMIVYNKDNDFTHSKLYILDDIAVISSANFTESGLWKNIEEIVVFSDKQTVDEIVGIFNRIKENELIRQLNPNEIGKQIE